MKKLFLRPSTAVLKTPLVDGCEVRLIYDGGRRELTLKLDNDGLALIDALQSTGVEEADERIKPLSERGLLIDGLDLILQNEEKYLSRQNRLLIDRVMNHAEFSDATTSLNNVKVTVIGLGGIGSNLAMALLRSGVGSINVVDFDIVDESNLNRQICFTHQDIGRKKVEVFFEYAENLGLKTKVVAVDDLCINLNRDIIDAHIVVNCADEPSIYATTRSILDIGAPAVLVIGGGYYCDMSYSGPILLPPFVASKLSILQSKLGIGENSKAVGGNTIATAMLPVALICQQLFNLITKTGTAKTDVMWVMDWRTMELQEILV